MFDADELHFRVLLHERAAFPPEIQLSPIQPLEYSNAHSE